MSEEVPDYETLRLRASTVFTPAQPIHDQRLFAGRSNQIGSIIDAINQPGQHAILYGERGVGKTSLANTLSAHLHRFGAVIAPRIGCFSTDTYSDLWRKAFNEIRVVVETPRAGLRTKLRTDIQALSSSMPDVITHDEVRTGLSSIAGTAIIVLIFDEFDTLADASTRRGMAETVKLLSDYGVDATLVFVGVADSVAGLLEDHRSLDRSMVQVRMPRMPDAELLQILSNGAATLGMTFETGASNRIIQLSRGLPHYAHLLGLCSGREALHDESLVVQHGHVERAIQVAIRTTQQSTIDAYSMATTSAQPDHLYREVLLACAVADTDQLGYFAPAAVRDPLSRIKRRVIPIPSFVRHLNEFCQEKRGCVLQRTGPPRKHRFRFTNPIMQPFVILHGIENGLLAGTMKQ